MANHDGPDRGCLPSHAVQTAAPLAAQRDVHFSLDFAPEFAPAILRSLLDHTPAIVSLYDTCGVHRYVNRVAPGLLSGDIIGRHISELVPHEYRAEVMARFDRAVESRQPEEFALPGVGPDGRGLEYRGRVVPVIHDDQVVAVLAVVTDGTDLVERREAELRTRRMLDQLARASRISTMREMASGLAHELNQPLSAIVAYVDACQELVESGRMNNQQLADVLRSVSKQAERAGRIIHRLRQMIRRDQPSRTLISINDAVGETAALFEATGRQTGVTIRVDMAGELPEVLADIVQIQHVLLNLMHNAIDAVRDLPQNRRQLTIVTSRPAEREVEVAVCDLGHGLTGESAGRLFEPFFSTNPHGLGLGLSISRTIIEAHGGRIEVVPNTDAGVTARFTLPVSSGKVTHVPTADSVHR